MFARDHQNENTISKLSPLNKQGAERVAVKCSAVQFALESRQNRTTYPHTDRYWRLTVAQALVETLVDC